MLGFIAQPMLIFFFSNGFNSNIYFINKGKEEEILYMNNGCLTKIGNHQSGVDLSSMCFLLLGHTQF